MRRDIEYFLGDLEKFLKSYYIKSNDIQSITKTIRSRINECSKENIENDYICMICKNEMDKPISSDLVKLLKPRFKNQTIDSIIDKINKYGNYKVLGIKNIRINDICNIICEDCEIGISETVNLALYEIPLRKEQQNLENKQNYENNIKEANISARNNNEHISKRFFNLKFLMDSNKWQEYNLDTMRYGHFLLTKYWDIIRKYKLYKSKYKCELCTNNAKLHVHHKTYENRGREIFNLQDLIVLCETCHKKFHDKQEGDAK